MNKVVNIFLMFLLAVYCFFVIGSIYDLNFSVYHIREIPFIVPIAFILAVAILLFGILRLKRQFVGIKDVNNFKGFVFTAQLSNKRLSLSRLFYLAEIVFYSFFIWLIYLAFYERDISDFDNTIYVVLGSLFVFILLSLYFILMSFSQKNKFIIGVNKNLVSYFDREIHVYYFDGLQRVDVYQNRLHFKYKKDLNMFMELDIISEEDLSSFKSALIEALNAKQVFVSETLREL